MAQSAELRRAYSGLYGRFAARALLTAHLGIGRFISLKREGIEVPKSISVKRISKGDIPDWLAWDDRAQQHVLCEAKGSLTANDFLAAGQPKCVKEGKDQFLRVHCTDPNGPVYPARWVAASRWSTDRRSGQAASLLWDPPTDHEPVSEEISRNHREAITRAWLDSLAPGLGWRDANELLADQRAASAITVRAEPGEIPDEEDWPEVGDMPLAKVSAAQARSTEMEKVITRVVSTLSSDDVYREDWVSAGRPPEPKALEAQYLSALVTPYGVRPIRGASDVDELRTAQDRAQRREQPAMLVGIPLGLDPAARLSDALWMDGGGIARTGDLAVFDLRRIEIDAHGISLA
ncbi:hypothetical protein ACO2Q3_12065 [Caulobacter sp. KR2-114]|uniref:hypothetical protein n=1 Tax=Caulobacter sp. KR2-114 TaxID=3400912 RepID=UPI003BFBB12C